MDYEKKYKEALEKARQLCIYPTSKPFISDLQDLFPELKESEGEDKKIRKALIEHFKWNAQQILNDFDNKEVLAWLEKQGKVPVTINIDKMVEDYANNEDCDNEGFGKPVNCMIRAYRQGLTDAIATVMLEKQGKNPIMAKSPQLGEQKPAWSKEDEKAINDIMWIIEAYRKDGFNETHIQMADNSEKWLKSLKQRIKL